MTSNQRFWAINALCLVGCLVAGLWWFTSIWAYWIGVLIVVVAWVLHFTWGPDPMEQPEEGQSDIQRLIRS